MVRLRALMRRIHGATGAMGAQLAQALASLLLSIAAARALGADGLGVYGLISGGLVLTTALATGLVGDSLTVLPRHETGTRAGLQIVGLLLATAAGLVSTIICAATGLLSWPIAALFGVASTAFILEEFMRRLLMASLKFWSVLVVDLTCLVVTAAWLGAVAALDGLSMSQILWALLASEVAAFAVAVVLLPHAERRIARFQRGEIVSVLRFGVWRAAQQGVRPAMLTLMRILVVVAISTVAFGELEAARVYTAPTLLMVNGIGVFLFATYAAERHHGLRALVRRADHGALSMFAAVLFAGVVAALLLPWAGRIVTGGQFAISELAVFGWVIYAATAAVLMPYGSLAAVSGMHVKVFNLRLLEGAVSLASVAVVLFVLHASASWTPYALALGPIVLGLVIRQYVLVPQAHEDERAAARATEAVREDDPVVAPLQQPASA
jgi:O-antigen/teichoic acid export membrane protein